MCFHQNITVVFLNCYKSSFGGLGYSAVHPDGTTQAMHEYAERIRKMPGTMYAAECDKNPDLDVDDLLSSDPQEVTANQRPLLRAQKRQTTRRDAANLTGLVLGCIEAQFCR